MEHRLAADGIELAFGSRKILHDVYISCETTKVTGLLGQNGQGKTSLFHIIYGITKAQSRSVRFDDQSVFEAFKRPDLITFLPQSNFVPAQLSLNRIFRDFELSLSDFVHFLPEFEGREKTQLSSLSGGQRRLVEVYLIIKSKSQFSLLDEPFSHLMPLHIEKISELIVEEKKAKGFLITDHLFRSVMEVSDALYLLKDGKTHVVSEIEEIRRLGYVV